MSTLVASGVGRAADAVAERWDRLVGSDGRPVRTLVAGRPVSGVPQVVLVPGLGAVRSLIAALRLMAGWTRCTLLDVPGFGHRGPRACAPTVDAVGATVAGWLRDHAPGPVVLAGHSTGAQSALRAAAAAPDAVAGLLLAGPTFAPPARRVAGLLRATAATVWREPPSGLRAVGPDYWRAGPRALARFVRSGMNDRPERTIAAVRCPVLLATGAADHLAPPDWTRVLAAAATGGDRRGPVRTVVVPAAHAFPFSRPARFVELAARLAALSA